MDSLRGYAGQLAVIGLFSRMFSASLGDAVKLETMAPMARLHGKHPEVKIAL